MRIAEKSYLVTRCLNAMADRERCWKVVNTLTEKQLNHGITREEYYTLQGAKSEYEKYSALYDELYEICDHFGALDDVVPIDLTILNSDSAEAWGLK